jgi:hypothetical protein
VLNSSIVTPKRALLLCILVVVLAAPAAAGSIERTITPQEGGLDITLTVNDIPVGGIVETLPEGCTWMGTDHPEDRTRVSGEKVAFAIIGEETITYQVQGPQDAAEAFAGTWEDLLTGDSGVVGLDEPGNPEQADATTPPSTPGFGCAAALAALAVLCSRRCGR